MMLLSKSLITSDDRNFASFARNVPGFKIRKFVTSKGATLSTEISATSGSQKFRNLQNFFNFFRKSRFFEVSTFDFFGEGGELLRKNIFEVICID